MLPSIPHAGSARAFAFCVAVGAALPLSCPDVVFAAVDPGTACAVAKHKASVKRLNAKVLCHGKALKKSVAVDAACLAKAEEKFETSFAKAESKGGCLISGDVAVVAAMVDAWLSELLGAVPATTTTTTTTTTIPPSGNCGDAILESPEECDDGNLSNGDGCSDTCVLEASATAFRLTSLYLISPRILITVPGFGCQDITQNPPTTSFGTAGDSINTRLNDEIDPVSDGGTYSRHLVNILSPADPASASSYFALHLDAACEEAPEPDSCEPDASPTVFQSIATNSLVAACFTPDPADVNTRAGVPAAYSPTVNTVAAPCFDTATGELIVEIAGLAIPLQQAHVTARYSGAPADELLSGVITGFLPDTTAADLHFPTGDSFLGGEPLYSVLQAGDVAVLNSAAVSVADSCNLGGGTHEDDADMLESVRGFWFFLNFQAEEVTW